MHIVYDNPAPGFGSLLQPTVHHQSPEAVLNDPDLAAHEKRAVLSSWASDLYAVKSCPWLREVPGIKNPLRLSDILAALRALDDDEPPPRGAAAMRVVHPVRTRACAFMAGALARTAA